MPLRNLLRDFEFICLLPTVVIITHETSTNDEYGHLIRAIKQQMKHEITNDSQRTHSILKMNIWKAECLKASIQRHYIFRHSVINSQQFSNTFSAVIFRNSEKPKGNITIIILMEINKIPQTNVTKLKRAAISIRQLNEKSYSPGVVCLPLWMFLFSFPVEHEPDLTFAFRFPHLKMSEKIPRKWGNNYMMFRFK